MLQYFIRCSLHRDRNIWWPKWLQSTCISSVNCTQNWELLVALSVTSETFGDVKMKHEERVHNGVIDHSTTQRKLRPFLGVWQATRKDGCSRMQKFSRPLAGRPVIVMFWWGKTHTKVKTARLPFFCARVLAQIKCIRTPWRRCSEGEMFSIDA